MLIANQWRRRCIRVTTNDLEAGQELQISRSTWTWSEDEKLLQPFVKNRLFIIRITLTEALEEIFSVNTHGAFLSYESSEQQQMEVGWLSVFGIKKIIDVNLNFFFFASEITYISRKHIFMQILKNFRGIYLVLVTILCLIKYLKYIVLFSDHIDVARYKFKFV